MKSYALLLVAILFGAAAVSMCYMARASKQAVGLLPDETVHDFGQLPQGTVVKHAFTLVNRCDTPIAIGDVVKSCACTEVACSLETLAPGQKMALSLDFSTGRARGKTRVGLLVKYLLPDGREFGCPVWVKADVLPDVLFEPEQLEFDAQHTEQRVKFRPGQLPSLTINRVSCTHPGFRARLLPSGDEVEVRVQPEVVAEGPPTTYLTVETNSANEPACSVPLVVRSLKSAGENR